MEMNLDYLIPGLLTYRIPFTLEKLCDAKLLLNENVRNKQSSSASYPTQK